MKKFLKIEVLRIKNKKIVKTMKKESIVKINIKKKKKKKEIN